MGRLHVWLSDGFIGLWLGFGSGAGAGRWGLSGYEGSDEGAPGWEDEIAGDGAQVLEEAPARSEGFAGLCPERLEGVAEAVEGEGQEVHGSQEGREVLLAVAEVVLEVIAVVLEHVEGLVLDLPARSAGRGELGDIGLVDPQVCDEAVPVGHLAGRVDNLDLEPVDQERILAVADRDAAQPAVAVGLDVAALLDALLVLRRLDPGEPSATYATEPRSSSTP